MRDTILQLVDKLKIKIMPIAHFLMQFWRNNPAYLICSICYFFICFYFVRHFFLLLILYIILLLIGFSSLGEKLLRIFNHVRPLETKQEKEYLKPLFDEVYMNAKKVFHNKNSNRIEICIIDTMTVNAVALGRYTIAVTKGAIQTFTEEELKAVMAHEVAHIVYGDTIVSLYTLIGNGIFSVLVLFVRLCLFLLDLLQRIFIKKRGFIFSLIFLFKVLFEGIILILNFGFQLILSVNSRKNEFWADSFSYSIGYDTDMIDALYLLERISLGDNSSIIQKMTASHPRITLRIKMLEELDESV